MINKEDEKWVADQMKGREVVIRNTQKKKREETVYKYSRNGKGYPRESCIIDGKAYFLRYAVTEKGKDFFAIEPYIDEETRKLVPPHMEECPFEPYIFYDGKELQSYLDRAKKETIHSLYVKIKSIVRLFNDIDDKTLNLISADILATYFQDRFSTVHYLIIVGDNGTGKSAIADTFAALGYRVVVMTNPTKAIWYRVLGPIEYGQVTIVADESEGIEESAEIMSILKDGYQTKHKIPRMDSDNKKPEWFFPFCIKIIICENSPTEYKAKGLLDRSFIIKTFKGYPQHDIKEIRNPQGNKTRQNLLDEIEDLRKSLLAFKLYHQEALPEIDIGLDGRDKELCKPLIQLFHHTESQKEIEETLQNFIDIKNERKNHSLEAVMFPIIVNAISQFGNKLPSRKLWEMVIDNLEGVLDEKNPNVFYSTDIGKLYINRVTKIATDKFGAEKKHDSKSNSILIFNPENVIKMTKIYGSKQGIQTKIVEIENDAPDAPDAVWKDARPFYMLNKDENMKKIDDISGNLRDAPEKIKEEMIRTQTRILSSASSASHASSDPNLEFPPDCYYCDEIFDGTGKQAYQTHVIQKHPSKPCYPGPADIELYSLTPKGMSWES